MDNLVSFEILDKTSLPERPDFKKIVAWLLKIAELEDVEIRSLSYNLCSDDFMLKVNRTYLNHDYFTDILTFPLSHPGQPIEADILVSIDRVLENAKHLQTPFPTELKRVFLHGFLHLCGYDDQTKLDEQVMRKAEDKYLAMF